jgi:predicted MFS family arabinose efflux permease
MFVVTAVLWVTLGGVGQFWTVYMDAKLKAPPALIGALAGMAMALTIPAALAIPWVVGRWGHPGGILRLSLGRMLGFLLLAGVAHWVAAAAGRMVLEVMAIVGTILTVYSLELVDPEWRPTMTGAISLALGVGWTVGGFLGGPIIHAWGYGGLYGLAAVLALAVGPGVWAYDRARRGAQPAAGAGPGGAH